MGLSGPWPRAKALVEANGYDPNEIVATTVDEEGYEAFTYDEAGNRLHDGHRFITVRKEWHSEQFGLDVMDAIWKDEGLS